MEAIIISIGSELLLGNVVDTNSRYLSRELSELGYEIHNKFTIGDNKEKIKELVKNVSCETANIFITGGLGSTGDDNTKEALIEVVGESEIQELAYHNVKNHYLSFLDKEKFELAMKTNVKVFTFPKGSVIFKNNNGSAFGFKVKVNNSYVYVMPGPPREMEPMFENEIKKDIVKYKTNDILKSRFYKLAFLREWEVNDRLKNSSFPDNVSVNTFISDDGCSIRVTIKENLKEAENTLDVVEREIYEVFGDLIYSNDGKSREEILIGLLTEKGLKLSTAESITGGLVASSLIGVDGASNVIEESYITYSDRVKEKVLKVSPSTLKEHTAVSEEVCEEMVNSLYSITKSKACIATTGYAGPSGDVGDVYIGIKIFDDVEIIHKRFSGQRNSIRNSVKNFAIDKLRESLLKKDVEEQ